MSDLSEIMAGVFADGSAMIVALLVFLATAVLTLGLMLTARARGAVKRRAAGIAEYSGQAAEVGDLRNSSRKAIHRLLDYAAKHYAATEKDRDDMRVLRRRMVQAGIFDSRAVGFFFLA